jgi:outer membrane protein OmpA-like peptidoglycan-associated protein
MSLRKAAIAALALTLAASAGGEALAQPRGPFHGGYRHGGYAHGRGPYLRGYGGYGYRFGYRGPHYWGSYYAPGYWGPFPWAYYPPPDYAFGYYDEAPPPPPPPPYEPPPAPPPPHHRETPPPARAPAAPERFVVYFPFDKAEITPDARAVIRSAANYAAAHPDGHVIIVGHTDTSGSEAYNQPLSERRAGAVRESLTADGIDFSRIEMDWKGKHDLAVDTGDGVKEPLNRRVTILVQPGE